jgi:hypothetical protein
LEYHSEAVFETSCIIIYHLYYVSEYGAVTGFCEICGENLCTVPRNLLQFLVIRDFANRGLQARAVIHLLPVSPNIRGLSKNYLTLGWGGKSSISGWLQYIIPFKVGPL